jgi:hypothetical protein
MVEGQDYFKPWRLVDYVETGSTGSTTASGSNTVLITPSQMGISSFDNGTYYFEFRFIGHRAIYPVCQSIAIGTLPTPTPTPTPTPVTPTPTPTGPTPTPTPSLFSSGATLNVTDTGYIKYESLTGQTYVYIGSIGTYTITECAICSTINVGIPFADLANFTITNCGTTCGGAGPTPTPTPTPASTVYYILVNCQNYITYYSQGYPDGTFNSGDRVEGSAGVYYVVSGYVVSTPMTQTFVYSTGQYGCP